MYELFGMAGFEQNMARYGIDKEKGYHCLPNLCELIPIEIKMFKKLLQNILLAWNEMVRAQCR